MKNRKFWIVLLLALVVILSMSTFVACNDKKDEDDNGGTPASTKPWEDGKNYSYRMAPASLPTSWNYHTYQSNDATYILDYTSDSLYTFDYADENCDKFTIVPSMASDYATDVTAQYVGKYGVTAADIEDGGKVYSIPLKHNLKFDNGDAITANTFVESMKLLLNPDAANFRADNVYKSGNLKIYGAESYLKQGSIVNVDVTDGEGVGYGDYHWGNVERDGEGNMISWECTVAEDVQKKIYFHSEDSYVGQWALEAYENAYTGAQIMANYVLGSIKKASEIEALNGKTLYEILNNDDYKSLLVSLCYKFWCTDPDEEFGFFCYESYMPEYSYDNVGFFAIDDYTLGIALKNAMANDFYLKYELCSSFFLVHPGLYSSCMGESQGAYTNDYATAVNKFIGYGPYKLTQYVADSVIVLERNLNWHGYSDEEYVEGTYQTDLVSYKKVTENSTRLEMFLKGEIDSYGLQAEDMEDYITSDYVYYNDSESTWYLAMNPGLDSLASVEETATSESGKTVVKRVLAIDDFRKALSYSLDREQFNLRLSPTSGIAKGLLSSMIYYDPENGASYRETDVAKDALLEFWGLADQWGEGKEYATRDEAIASITGYDPNGAKELFTSAYNQAVEAGYIPSGDNWIVQIVIGIPVTAKFYNDGSEFLKTNWTAAVVGTPFEGHLEFINSQELGSSSFGDYLRNGSVDLLFGVGYGGSMFDPYSMMDCFTGSLQYDPYTDKETINMDVTYDFGQGEKTYRASLYDWVSECLQGNTITVSVVGEDGEVAENPETMELALGVSASSEARLYVLATAEAKILTLANIFPMQTDSTASLRCMRVIYKTEEYILGMGRGGIQYYTYAMDDAEFLAYAASQADGKLNYKG